MTRGSATDDTAAPPPMTRRLRHLLSYPSVMMRVMDHFPVISCDDCVMQNTDTCDDCVVTFICNRDPDEAIVIDVAEARAVRMMGEAGLVPMLKQVRRAT